MLELDEELVEVLVVLDVVLDVDELVLVEVVVANVSYILFHTDVVPDVAV